MLDRWSQGRQAIVMALHVVCFGPQHALPLQIAHIKPLPWPLPSLGWSLGGGKVLG